MAYRASKVYGDYMRILEYIVIGLLILVAAMLFESIQVCEVLK